MCWWDVKPYLINHFTQTCTQFKQQLKTFLSVGSWSRHVLIVGLFAHKILLRTYLLAHTHTHTIILACMPILAGDITKGPLWSLLSTFSHASQSFSDPPLFSHASSSSLILTTLSLSISTLLFHHRSKTHLQTAAAHWTLCEYSRSVSVLEALFSLAFCSIL